MTPDLNQLRRDLGQPAADSSRRAGQTYTTVDVVSQPAQETPASGIRLNELGLWLLAIVGGILAIWLLMDPIFMMLGFLWGIICAAVSFIFTLIIWFFAIMFGLWFIGNLFR